MRYLRSLCAISLLVAGTIPTPSLAEPPEGPSRMRPPAYPLVTCDPYFSVWSMTDKLTDSWPRHWTGATMGMCGLIRVDGKTYRWCGSAPADIPAAEQRVADISSPTETTYQFRAGPVDLTVVFSSSLSDDVIGTSEGRVLPSQELVLASVSASSIKVFAACRDDLEHDIQIYLDVSGEWVVHDPAQKIHWSRHEFAGVPAISMGTVDQPVLAAAGDNRRIDWGRLLMVADGAGRQLAIAAHTTSREHFAKTGKVLSSDDARMPRAASDDYPVLSASFDAPAAKKAGGQLHLVYDDEFSIELFGQKLRPFWNLDGANVGLVIAKMLAGPDQPIVSDGSFPPFMATSTRVGGDQFRQLVTLAYRQVLAGHRIVAAEDGTPLMFSKENTSNGCIATVDVIYPACPFFLYHSPEMLKAQLRPLLMYAASPRWKFPFAPHDLGTYPKANGQVYGGGEKTEENQMPVEESGNMLIMLAALAKVEHNADFSKPYLPILEKWAAYLQEHGIDPAHQLCTDDFAGHLARNANLSAKTVVALGAYAQLLTTMGEHDKARRWDSIARYFAKRWLELSKDGPTDDKATVLAFGNPGTWSQKYNLIWDRVLGLNLFEQEVFDREMKLYHSKMQRYGLPLDSRKTYTKLDWTVWSACLTGRRADFETIMNPVYTWVSETPSRVPLSDWYETTDGITKGMHTRTVVGGMWMPLLMEQMGVGLK
ncbi:MAG: DUF4965 domain-containing protein [Phycisphaerales bacterium]|nr:DUF4965 domain-containing protein [Phycisphaerales bacterium]